MMDYITLFSYVEPFLYHWDKSHLMYNPFNMLLNLVCKYSVENFCINIHKGYSSIAFFSCGFFICLWYQGNADCIE